MRQTILDKGIMCWLCLLSAFPPLFQSGKLTRTWGKMHVGSATPRTVVKHKSKADIYSKQHLNWCVCSDKMLPKVMQPIGLYRLLCLMMGWVFHVWPYRSSERTRASVWSRKAGTIKTLRISSSLIINSTNVFSQQGLVQLGHFVSSLMLI